MLLLTINLSQTFYTGSAYTITAKSLTSSENFLQKPAHSAGVLKTSLIMQTGTRNLLSANGIWPEETCLSLLSLSLPQASAFFSADRGTQPYMGVVTTSHARRIIAKNQNTLRPLTIVSIIAGMRQI
jgi:hypothetical protein